MSQNRGCEVQERYIYLHILPYLTKKLQAGADGKPTVFLFTDTQVLYIVHAVFDFSTSRVDLETLS